MPSHHLKSKIEWDLHQPSLELRTLVIRLEIETDLLDWIGVGGMDLPHLLESILDLQEQMIRVDLQEVILFQSEKQHQ